MQVERSQQFQALLETVHPRAWRFCRRMCTSSQDAEDLYQDALLAAFRGLPKLTDQSKFGSWLFQIIANTIRNHERRKRWSRWVGLGVRDDDTSPNDVYEPATADPRGQFAARHLLRRAWRTLKADERALVVLCELEEYTTAEASRLLGQPEGTVKSRLSRARAKMRTALATVSAVPNGAAHHEVEYGLQPHPTTTE